MKSLIIAYKPKIFTILIAIISSVFFALTAQDETVLIKSIDYVFIISLWSYLLLSIPLLVEKNLTLSLISCFLFITSNIYPFLTKTNEKPIDFIVGYSIGVFLFLIFCRFLSIWVSSKIICIIQLIISSTFFVFLLFLLVRSI